MRRLISASGIVAVVVLLTGQIYGFDMVPPGTGMTVTHMAEQVTAPASWGAHYDMFYGGVNTDGDQFLDQPYLFTYGWLFNLFNSSGSRLPEPKITATWSQAIAGISASPNPPATVPQTSSPAIWSAATLELQGTPGGGMAGSVWTNQPIPQPYRLGYEVTRTIIEGRQVPAGAVDMARTFRMTFTSSDSTLSHIAASIDFTDQRPNPGPVSTSEVICSGPGWVTMVPGMPVFWKVGEVNDPPPVPGETYTLICTFKLTNSSSSPALFAPSILVTGRRLGTPAPGVGSMTYTAPGVQADPPDPFGSVTFETGDFGAEASLAVGFNRSVTFNGVNKYDDEIPPTTTATVSPAPNELGWNNGPVTVTLTAADPGGSGVKQIWYWLQYLHPGSPPPPPTSTPPTAVPGSTATITDFPVPGFTTVNYAAEDFAGNQEPWKSVTVRIDTTPPVTMVGSTQPPPMSIGGKNWWKVDVVTVMINAIDPCNPNIPCSGPRRIWYKLDGAQTSPLTSVGVPMPPNTAVPVSVSASGTTTLTYYAEDNAGNVEASDASKAYVVNIDRTPPVLTLPPNMIREATGPAGALVTFTASANDAGSGSGPVTCAPASGSLFPVGSTTVSCSATDAVGYTAAGTFTIAVREKMPPVIETVTASPGVLWPVNHQMVSIALAVKVSDNVTLAPACRVVSVTSNEPLNGSGDGNTATDYTFSGVGLDLSLRAERAGNRTDRIYTAAVVCRDDVGNDSAPKTVAIVVPHDQGKK